jgi:hypothetical protein
VADGRPDHGIETLLDLDGWADEVRGGFWVSVKAFRVPPDACRPQGINYSLSMHAPSGERLVGYDNAHPPKIGSGPAARSKRRRRGCDHRHFRGRIAWYEFQSPVKLMKDFWRDVQTILEEEGVPWAE